MLRTSYGVLTVFGPIPGSATASNAEIDWWDLGIYVKSKTQYTSLDLSVPGRAISTSRRDFSDNGWAFLNIPHGVIFARPIANSVGGTIAAKRSNDEARLSPDSQIPPYIRKSDVVEECEWPGLGRDYRHPEIRGKFSVLCAHRAWIVTDVDGVDPNAAL